MNAKVKLKHIATINAGYPFRGKVPEAAGSSVVAVQMKDVSPTEGIHWPSCTPTALAGKRDHTYLTPGDILLAARGSHNYAAQVDNNMAAGIQAVAAPHFFVLTLNRSQVLPDFMVWQLNQAPCQRYFEQNAEGTLTKSIRRSVLENTPVVLPPLSKQHAIVSMANTLRQEQQLAQQLVFNAQRLMSAIAHDLFKNKA